VLPGAGSVYDGIYVNAIIAASVSLAGAGLWVAGAVRHDDTLRWTGIGTFAAGRGYGLVSATVGAMLFNAALQRQLFLSVPL